MNELRQALHQLATKEQVMSALGMEEDTQDEEFWKIQFFTVKNRFLSYLLFKHRLDMTLVAEERLDDEVEMDLLSTAEDMLQHGITYTFIRTWWKIVGTYLHNRAFEAKREQEKLNKMDIVVLVFFSKGHHLSPKGRPYYLAFKGLDMVMVEDKKDAHGFPIMSANDIERNALIANAVDFESVVKRLGATHLKLLPRQKD